MGSSTTGPAERSVVDRWVERRFFKRLIKRTKNFADTTWLGNPIWQNVLDLWTIQETIAAVKPTHLIETGTNRGGSSLFYAQLMDLMGIPVEQGKIITIDVEKLHSLSHPRVTYVIGSSVSGEVMSQVKKWMAGGVGSARVMVILDSDHSRKHVREELELYAPLVTSGSYLLCQDGVIDELPMFHKHGEEGPRLAVEDFLRTHPEFEVDHAKCDRFLISHHPLGWLRRK